MALNFGPVALSAKPLTFTESDLDGMLKKGDPKTALEFASAMYNYIFYDRGCFDEPSLRSVQNWAHKLSDIASKNNDLNKIKQTGHDWYKSNIEEYQNEMERLVLARPITNLEKEYVTDFYGKIEPIDDLNDTISEVRQDEIYERASIHACPLIIEHFDKFLKFAPK